MTTATDILRGALERHDWSLPDKSAGEHDRPRSTPGPLPEDNDLRLIARAAQQKEAL